MPPSSGSPVRNWGEGEIRGGYNDKKENQIFLTYMAIQNGAVANSYMTNDLLIYGEIFAHFLIY
jgi:hypothetical protein